MTTCNTESSSSTKRTAGLFLMAAAASFLNPTASAFTPLSHSSGQVISTTALHLKSGQGNQLVAAYNAAAVKKKKNLDGDNDDESVLQRKVESAPANPKARSLAARLFSLDFHNHQKNIHKVDDVVYFPLVGFKLVHHEGRVVPLPTKSHAACRIPTRAQANEEVFGWYSPACSLDLYSEDICHEPIQETDES